MLSEFEPDKTKMRIRNIRNVLNAVFILLSLVAMVGIGITMSEPTIPFWCYVVAIIAVIVKMVESVIRMNESTRGPRRSRFDRRNERR